MFGKLIEFFQFGGESKPAFPVTRGVAPCDRAPFDPYSAGVAASAREIVFADKYEFEWWDLDSGDWLRRWTYPEREQSSFERPGRPRVSFDGTVLGFAGLAGGGVVVRPGGADEVLLCVRDGGDGPFDTNAEALEFHPREPWAMIVTGTRQFIVWDYMHREVVELIEGVEADVLRDPIVTTDRIVFASMTPPTAVMYDGWHLARPEFDADAYAVDPDGLEAVAVWLRRDDVRVVRYEVATARSLSEYAVPLPAGPDECEGDDVLDRVRLSVSAGELWIERGEYEVWVRSTDGSAIEPSHDPEQTRVRALLGYGPTTLSRPLWRDVWGVVYGFGDMFEDEWKRRWVRLTDAGYTLVEPYVEDPNRDDSPKLAYIAPVSDFD